MPASPRWIPRRCLVGGAGLGPVGAQGLTATRGRKGEGPWGNHGFTRDRRRGLTGEPWVHPCVERTAARARRGASGRVAGDGQPQGCRTHPRGVAGRRPLVDGGPGLPALLRPRARGRTERRRLSRRGATCVVF